MFPETINALCGMHIPWLLQGFAAASGSNVVGPRLGVGPVSWWTSRGSSGTSSWSLDGSAELGKNWNCLGPWRFQHILKLEDWINFTYICIHLSWLDLFSDTFWLLWICSKDRMVQFLRQYLHWVPWKVLIKKQFVHARVLLEPTFIENFWAA